MNQQKKLIFVLSVSVSVVVVTRTLYMCTFEREITFPHKFRTVFRAVDHSIVFYIQFSWVFLDGFILPTYMPRTFRCVFLLRCWFAILYFAHINTPVHYTHTHTKQKQKKEQIYIPAVIRRASIVELHSTCTILCVCMCLKLTTGLCSRAHTIRLLKLLVVLCGCWVFSTPSRFFLYFFFAEGSICIVYTLYEVYWCWCCRRRWFFFFTFYIFIIMIFLFSRST